MNNYHPIGSEYVIKRVKHGMLVSGPQGIPASEAVAITKMAEALGYNLMDMSISSALGAVMALTNKESGEKWRAEIEERVTRNRDTVEAWLKGADVGMSSKALAMTLSGMAVSALGKRECKAHPYDPADIGRCFRMLDRFPELRENLHLMKKASPVWEKLIDRWDDLRALYNEEFPTGKAPKLYDLIQELIH